MMAPRGTERDLPENGERRDSEPTGKIFSSIFSREAFSFAGTFSGFTAMLSGGPAEKSTGQGSWSMSLVDVAGITCSDTLVSLNSSRGTSAE